MAIRVYVQTLGCPKNLVDSEMMLGLLARDGAEIVLDPSDADVVVVNTCGFIGPAKQESIDTILELARYKQDDPAKRLVVTGCLAQRYGSQLAEALPEVDAFLGTGDFDRLPAVVGGRERGDASRYGGAAHLLPDTHLPRLRTGEFFSAFLKISEGCNHRCAFCIIPKIRGRHQSRPLHSVVAEAQHLVDEGVVELNLIAQDLTAYGRDLRDGSTLAGLLRELATIQGLRWIRLLYTYPNYVDRDLLETIASHEAICSYIDMPLQHISDRMLRSMRRERSGRAVRQLLQRIRDAIPGVAVRSAFIVGFPGETDDDFAELRDFLGEARLDRVGVFEYSPEEGTEAEQMPGQVPAATAKHRRHVLMHAQARVARELNERLVGTTREVLVCGTDARGRRFGRLATQAPEIDGVVYLTGAGDPGTFAPVEISRAGTYDVYGAICGIDRPGERPYTPAPPLAGPL